MTPKRNGVASGYHPCMAGIEHEDWLLLRRLNISISRLTRRLVHIECEKIRAGTIAIPPSIRVTAKREQLRQEFNREVKG